jgi:hypothetical protein
MFANAAKLSLTLLALSLFATSADAQQRVHRACTKVKDKVKCTCFRENGGHIVNRPGGSRRAVINSMAEVDGYIACMRRNGRPNG